MGGLDDRLNLGRAAARHPHVTDVLLALVVAGGALVTARFRPHAAPSVLNTADYVGASIAFMLLIARRRWPLPVMVVATLSTAVLFATVGGGRSMFMATVVAAFTVANQTDRGTAWLASGAAAIVLYAASARWSGHSWVSPENVGVIAWVGMATAVGEALRSRRASVTAIEERARRAEESREHEAHRQVAEERLRIARELHDVVAHHIALINVQAGVAAHLLRDRPDQAEQALGHIRDAAGTVLQELGPLLSVLRQSDETDAPTEPAPGLDRLADLLAALARAGMPVAYRQAGGPTPLPPTVDLAAYRIVQEALTNAHKHGTGATAQLRLHYRPDALCIEVTNPVAHPPQHPDGTGHGIVGMRERATAMGGTLHAGPAPNGVYALQARLPLPAPTGDRG